MQNPKSNNNPESGNVLIYIIGAIFLIGLLTVILKGATTPGSGIDYEAMVLKASKVRSYAAEVERGVSYVLRNGHSETEISFAHPNAPSAYGSYGSNPSAEVFNPQGGGAEWKDNDSTIQTSDEDWVFTATSDMNFVGDSNNMDLVAVLPYITEDVCLYINEQTGIDSDPIENLDNFGDAYVLTPFSGSFAGGEVFLGDTPTEYKMEGCAREAAGGGGSMPDGTMFYYKVLLAR